MQKKILITFGRSYLALHWARLLHEAGHEVFTADTMLCPMNRFSNAVSKCFKVPSPRFDPEGYITEIANIVIQKKIDLILPIFEEIALLSTAKHRFPDSCTLFSPSFELFDQLHNKGHFQSKLEKLKIETLKFGLVQSDADLRNLRLPSFILKSCYSRATVAARPHEGEINIEPNRSMIAQEWKNGDKFFSYSLCREGEIHAHCTHIGKYSINGHASISFESCEHEKIYKWVEYFVRQIAFTGQIGFDFVETPEKNLYVYECNPRSTEGLLLFDPKMQIDLALFGKAFPPISPKPQTRKQLVLAMLLYGWKKDSSLEHGKFLKNLFTIPDPLFSFKDSLPFIFMPLVFLTLWLRAWKQKKTISEIFTYDHEWNGCENRPNKLFSCSKTPSQKKIDAS